MHSIYRADSQTLIDQLTAAASISIYLRHPTAGGDSPYVFHRKVIASPDCSNDQTNDTTPKLILADKSESGPNLRVNIIKHVESQVYRASLTRMDGQEDFEHAPSIFVKIAMAGGLRRKMEKEFVRYEDLRRDNISGIVPAYGLFMGAEDAVSEYEVLVMGNGGTPISCDELHGIYLYVLVNCSYFQMG